MFAFITNMPLQDGGGVNEFCETKFIIFKIETNLLFLKLKQI